MTHRPRRSPAYLAFIRRHPCAVCGGGPVEAHHVKIRGTVALGRKPSDYQTVPLCPACHRSVHDQPVTAEQRAIMGEAIGRLLVDWMEGRRG